MLPRFHSLIQFLRLPRPKSKAWGFMGVGMPETEVVVTWRRAVSDLPKESRTAIERGRTECQSDTGVFILGKFKSSPRYANVHTGVERVPSSIRLLSRR